MPSLAERAGVAEQNLDVPGLERIVSAISSQLIAAESGAIDDAIRAALAQLGDACSVDRAYLIAFDPEGRQIEMAAEWCAPGIAPVAADLFGMEDDTSRWWSARVLLGEPVFIADVAALEPTDEPAAHLLRAQGVGSLLLVPVVIDGVPRGAIGMATVQRVHRFTDEVAALLRLTGQTFISRLGRARMERALAIASEELADRNADLERSNRDLEEFAYVASHDLKSPLLVVRGFLELLGRNKADVLGDDGRTYVAAALRGTERMEQLMDALLAFSRAGRLPMETRPVAMGDIVGQVVIDLAPAIKAAGAQITIGELPTLIADGVQLAQLFENLIANAVKYVRADVPPVVTITASCVGGEWHIEVVDNGIGIAASDRLRIFQMFSRLEAARDTPGSGIGLAICQRVVQAHGGRLWVEPADGQGSRFVVALPASLSS